MTEELNNVYIGEIILVAGKLEGDGPMGKYFDKVYKSYYLDKSLELSESYMINDAVSILFRKTGLNKDKIDLFVGGDLLNQICANSYAIKRYNAPFLGVFAACATSNESIIIGSKFIEGGNAKNVICTTSSHNLTSEKQFRNPIEYGYTKPVYSTTTSTGACSVLLTNKKSKIKISSYTIGKIVDMNQKDVNNMGAVMAPSAADTIYTHLNNLGVSPSYYDFIVTGDLGKFGREILKEYIFKEYNIKLSNYDDCGAMLYDFSLQPITAGGSGPVCSCLVNYGFIYNKLLSGDFKRVLLVTTGALFSPCFVFQKQNLLGIAHAISLESVL